MIIKSLRVNRALRWFFTVAAALLLFGCAHYQKLPPEADHWVYVAEGAGHRVAESWAPAFVAYDHAEAYNRIGRPTVRQERDGDQEIYIDPESPVVYFLKRTFTTDKATYSNMIYRIHFPKVPFSLIPFNLTAGKNVGILLVVTLDAGGRPVLVTSVGTCGCYKAIIPTEYLPKDAFPKGWQAQPVDIYGEQLPPLLKFRGIRSPRILVYLRPEVHRVMNLEVRDEGDLSGQPFRIIPMKVEPMDQLDRLPVDDSTTSFYYTDGLMKGHVKGSIKPLETLLMSLISLDLFVGSDKAYADTAETDNPFYTSLKPWRREDSNMWDFARFLHYWGWRL